MLFSYKFGKRNLNFLKKGVIFSDNISKTLEKLYNDRKFLYKTSVEGKKNYLKFWSDEKLISQYKRVLIG